MNIFLHTVIFKKIIQNKKKIKITYITNTYITNSDKILEFFISIQIIPFSAIFPQKEKKNIHLRNHILLPKKIKLRKIKNIEIPSREFSGGTQLISSSDH